MSHKSTTDIPSTLEEAFDLVNRRIKQDVINVFVNKDPFATFLVNMTECLKKEKKCLSEQKEITNNALTHLTEEKQKNVDPFQSFLSNMTKSLKKEKGLITEADQLDTDEEEEQEELKTKDEPKKAQSNFNDENEQPVDNSQVKEYLNGFGPTKNFKNKSSKRANIDKIIAEQVSIEFNKLKQQINFSSGTCGGGGGGTNAVQYAAGGVMNGDLNVTGRILSGGVDITTLLTNAGGAPTDRLIAGTQTLQLNTDGTLTFPNNILESSIGIVATEGLSSLGPMLSGNRNLTDIFLSDPVHLDAGIF